MNNLKLKGLALCLICLFAFNLNAQTAKENAQSEMRKEHRPHKTLEEKAQHATDKMTKKLGLDENQQAEIYALNVQEAENRKAIRSRMKDKLQAEQMARYKTVLTADQYAKLESFHAEGKVKGKKENHGKPGALHHGKGKGMQVGKGNAETKAQRMTDKMSERLDLNEQQKTDILAINRQEANNREEIRTQIKKNLRAEQMARYKTILTPEQYTTLEKLQVERQAKRAEHKENRGKSQYRN